MRDDFAVFILTHGRADNVITAKTLNELGYSGKWYVVIDTEDDQENLYRKNFPGRVLQFDKAECAKTFDTMDTSEDRRTIVYARNICFQLAHEVGVRYFLELDDDYTDFQNRWKEDGKLKINRMMNLDQYFEAMVDFLIDSGASSVAFAQGGDFIGGANNKRLNEGLLRKCMNTFFCDAEKPFSFVGRINEDVNTYTVLGSRGFLFFTYVDSMITQKQTQKQKSGMSDVYLDGGTYTKTFYSVVGMPSCVKVCEMGESHRRIHHRVEWEDCVPLILNERHKKKQGVI